MYYLKILFVVTFTLHKIWWHFIRRASFENENVQGSIWNSLDLKYSLPQPPPPPPLTPS